MPAAERSVHPSAFTILFLPYGMAAGYVTVTLAYLLSHAGLGVERIAGLVTLQLLPQTWKVFWAPIVDTTLTARRWYLISTVTTGAAILAMTLTPSVPGSLWVLSALVLISSIACSFSAIATEWLMAHSTPDNLKGRAGGWSQAGNLGGAGLGGGLALWMAQHTQAWSGGALLALLCVLCAIPLVRFKTVERSPPGTGGSTVRAIRAVGRDVWDLGRTRVGYLTLLLFILPIGTGAASGLWPAIADDWRVSGDTVALVNGVLGGLLSMAGCLAGGYVCDIFDRKAGYALAGIGQALCVIAMGLGSRTPQSFVFFTCLYAFLNGCSFASFTAAALETVGRRSAATNYNLLACFSNIPIAYMTTFEGHAQGRWGSSGMLYTEAVFCACAVLVFSAVVFLTRPRFSQLPSPAT